MHLPPAGAYQRLAAPQQQQACGAGCMRAAARCSPAASETRRRPRVRAYNSSSSGSGSSARDRGDWGPYSASSSSSAAQKAFQQALSHPLGDLGLDFNATYLNGRRRSSCITDAVACTVAHEDAVGPADWARLRPGSRASTKRHMEQRMQERDSEMCDVLLDFQRLASGQRAPGACGALLEAADLVSRHATGADHTLALNAEVERLVALVRRELEQQAAAPGPSGRSGAARGTAAVASPSSSANSDAPAATIPASRAAALVQAVNRAMYGGADGGYCGPPGRDGQQDFYNPENHLLIRVVQTKTGSPAALALLYWEVSRRVGLPMEVCLLPGHTFLRPSVPGGSTWLVDPFNGGQVCSQQVVEARLNSNWGLVAPQLSLGTHQPTAAPPPPFFTSATPAAAAHGPLHEAAAPQHAAADGAHSAGGAAGTLQGQHQTSSGAGLHPGSAPGALLLRLLSNLRESWWCPLPASGLMRWGGGAPSARQALVWNGLQTTRLMRVLTPGTAHLVRDEGYALSQLGKPHEGMELLRAYLACAEGAEDLRRVQEWVVPEV